MVLLFIVLLGALSGMLSVGLGLFTAVDRYLDECNDYFRTVVNLEYVGPNYGLRDHYDLALAESLPEQDLEEVAALPGVISWDPNRSALAVPAGLERRDPEAAAQEPAILVVSQLLWDDHTQSYQGLIQESLYSFKDVTNKTVFISGKNSEPLGGIDLTETRTYVFSGQFFGGQTSYLWFRPEAMEIMREGVLTAVPKATPLYEDGLPADSVYRDAALALSRLRNGVRVSFASALEDQLPFQQEILSLKEGRLFAAEESGERICVISEWLSNKMELSVGDFIDFSLFYGRNCGIFSAAGLAENADYCDRYEVVGITSHSEDYNDVVYVPYGTQYNPDPVPTGYTVGQFRVENARADEFSAAAAELLDDSYRLTAYNQGYEITAEPYREMLRIAAIFLAVCLLVVIAVVLLFGYLFVSRQRETARTMYALGSSMRGILAFFASGAAMLVVPAAILGILAGTALQDTVFSYVADFAAKYQQIDLRYSNAALTIVKTLPFEAEMNGFVYWLAFGLMVLSTLLSTCCFAAESLRKKRVRRIRVSRRYRGRTSVMSGVFKYSILSLIRSKTRTAAVVSVVLIIALFLGVLTSTGDRYREQLDAIRENTEIRAYVTDPGGLRMDGLYVRNEDVQALFDCGLADVDVSARDTYYLFNGVCVEPDGTVCEVEGTKIPGSAFAQETLRDRMAEGSMIVMTTSLQNLPEFYYETVLDVTWMEGYDESCLQGDDPALCVIPHTMMERDGVMLGSKIQLFTYEFDTRSYYVAGSYVSKGESENIFVPFNYEVTLGREIVPMPERARNPIFKHEGTDACVLVSGVSECENFIDYYVHIPTASAEDNIQFVNWASIWTLTEDPVGQYAVASLPYMKEHGLVLGEEMILTAPDGTEYPYLLIGTFRGHLDELYDVYCTAKPYDREIQWTEYDENERFALAVNSAVLTLNDTADLELLRNKLEELRFQKVHGDREGLRGYVVMDDKDYTETVRSLERQITYTDLLYQCLYVLSMLIGLTVSFLLVQARKPELAIMRSLGERRSRIFLKFAAEQLLLALLGCLMGFALWRISRQPVDPLYSRLLGVFILCWMVGTALCLLRHLAEPVYALVSRRED